MDGKKSATVLIVGDDLQLLRTAAREKFLGGYEPILAASGEEALRVAAEQPQIDLLLADIMMPDLNGVDFIKQFSKLFPETNVLYMIP